MHPDMESRHARLADDARDTEASLHRGGRWARSASVRGWVPWPPTHSAPRRSCIRAQARRPLAHESQEDEAERDDAIHTGANLRVGPRRNDREHRDGDSASTDQPPAAWPHEQRRRGSGEEQGRREPQDSSRA